MLLRAAICATVLCGCATTHPASTKTAATNGVAYFKAWDLGRSPYGIDPLTPAEAKGRWHWELVREHGEIVEAREISPAGLLRRRREVLRGEGGGFTVHEIDARGRVVAVRTLDAAGTLTVTHRTGSVGSEECHHLVLAFDARGRVLERTCYDEANHPFPGIRGCERVVEERNDRNHIVADACLRADGTPATFRDRRHRSVTVVNELGEETRMDSFGLDGKPLKPGCAHMINSFAPNGLLERKRCLTDDGGFDAEERRDYDANGCRVSIRYHDAEGRLTTMSGVARLQYAVDDLCEDVRITRYDATGRLVGRVAIRELQRDALGRVVHERCWAPGKKPTNCGGGDTEDGSTMTMAYDDYDRMVSRKCHDIAGSPTSCGVGKAFEERIEWDARGREIARSYFGVDGKPALDLGAARVVSTYDSVGVVHDRRFFGTQGEPVRPTTGCHQIVYVRDAHHQLASVECRDTLGVLTAGHLCYGEACLGGAARVVVERPTFSHLVNVHFDADGKELERVDCDLHACFR